ncbi:MAG: hypothetical protein PVH37_10490, partial [Desulfobacterales bacterium]
QKVGFSDLTSFRRKPESSKFKGFWIPDQVRHDGRWTFYGTVKSEAAKKKINSVQPQKSGD